VTTGGDEKYPRRLGPFALVTPLLESGGVSLSPALRRRGLRAERCLITHLRLGGKHAGVLDRRFRRGTELGRRLRHRAIAATLAVGRIGDRLFVAHEFLAGVHLGRLPPREMDVTTAAYVAWELTRALARLHTFEGRRLVHHGVTPVNVHLGWDGRVKLLECGLALSARHSEADEDAPRSFRGLARYAAPEVRAGAPGDARSDVYSVGVVLWELLAGRAFEDDRAPDGPRRPPLRDDETTDRRAEDSRSGPRAPAGLYAVVAKAMSPDPLRRHTDAEELGEALADFAPSRLAGRRAVRKLLGRLFDVGGSRRKVDEQLQAARPLLEQPEGSVVEPAVELEPLTPVPAAVPGRKPPRTLLRVVGLLALGGLALVAEKRFAPGPATNDPAVVTVAVDRPAREAPAPNPPTAEAPAPIGETATSEPARLVASDPPAPRERAPRPRAVAPALRIAVTQPRLPRPRRDDEAQARALDALKSAEERFQWGDLEGAQRLAQEAAGKLARNPRAFYFLGVVLLARGDASAAGDAFERVLELDPAHPDAAAKLRLAQEKARALPSSR
jgi:serine/threonine-protein kinase